MKDIAKSLVNPERNNRPWAIWIWNLLLSKEQVLKQLDQFIEKGFAGVAIRPSRDMAPAYLSEDFFSLFEVVLQKAKAANIGVRLADDFSMPLNNLFKQLTDQNRKAAAGRLSFEHGETINSKVTFSRTIPDPANVIVMVGKSKDGKLLSAQVKQVTVNPNQPVFEYKFTGGEWQIIILRKSVSIDPVLGALPNILNPRVADWYCQTVLGIFKKRFFKYIPETLEGFITEMPSTLPAEQSIPWDDELSSRFRARFKKDLLLLVPALFCATDAEGARHRVQAVDFITQNAIESFAEVLEAWANKNRFSQWTLIAERDCTRKTGIATPLGMPKSKKLTQVGWQNLDGSSENSTLLKVMGDANVSEFKRNTLTVLGRSKSGVGHSLQTLKNEIDQSFSSGVSTIIIDGFYCNVDQRNYGKAPFNPFWYSPEWASMRTLTDYAGRLNLLFGSLRTTRQVAILVPSAALIADNTAHSEETIKHGLQLLDKVYNELQQAYLSCELISESMLMECTVRPNGEFGVVERLRKGNFQALVLPYSRTISRNVLIYLEKLAAHKGCIIFTGESPLGVIEEGITPAITSRIEKLEQSRHGKIHTVPVKDIAPMLNHIISQFSVTSFGKPMPELACISGDNGTQSVFSCRNISDREEAFATMNLDAPHNLYYLDGNDGKLYDVDPIVDKDKRLCYTVNIMPRQNTLLIASATKIAGTQQPGKNKKNPLYVFKQHQRNYRVVLKDQWDFLPDGLNALPLSNWNSRIGISRESGSFSHFYETYFEAKDVPVNCYLVAAGMRNQSSPYDYSCKTVDLSLNGNKLIPTTIAATPANANIVLAPGVAPRLLTEVAPILKGSNVSVYECRDSLKKGFNRVALHSTAFINEPFAVMYPLFIAGKFAIAKGQSGWVIDDTRQVAGINSWTRSGYPYFSGTGIYKQLFEVPSDYERLVLKMSHVSGIVSISLNGKDLGKFNWHPIEIDITDSCDQKRNELCIRITNTVDNVLRMNSAPSGILDEVYIDIF